MSDEYIKRDDTLKAMDTWDKFGCDGHGRLVPYTEEYVPYVKFDDMMRAVEGQPSADVVEVVRCKDCKWFNRFGCAVEIVDFTDRPTENDYCSFGERKDEEADK